MFLKKPTDFSPMNLTLSQHCLSIDMHTKNEEVVKINFSLSERKWRLSIQYKDNNNAYGCQQETSFEHLKHEVLSDRAYDRLIAYIENFGIPKFNPSTDFINGVAYATYFIELPYKSYEGLPIVGIYPKKDGLYLVVLPDGRNANESIDERTHLAWFDTETKKFTCKQSGIALVVTHWRAVNFENVDFKVNDYSFARPIQS